MYFSLSYIFAYNSLKSLITTYCLNGSKVEINLKIVLTLWFLIPVVLGFEFLVDLVPLLVEVLPVILVLLHSEHLLLVGIHPEGLFKGEGINLLQNSFQCDQAFLQYSI